MIIEYVMNKWTRPAGSSSKQPPPFALDSDETQPLELDGGEQFSMTMMVPGDTDDDVGQIPPTQPDSPDHTAQPDEVQDEKPKVGFCKEQFLDWWSHKLNTGVWL